MKLKKIILPLFILAILFLSSASNGCSDNESRQSSCDIPKDFNLKSLIQDLKWREMLDNKSNFKILSWFSWKSMPYNEMLEVNVHNRNNLAFGVIFKDSEWIITNNYRLPNRIKVGTWTLPVNSCIPTLPYRSFDHKPNLEEIAQFIVDASLKSKLLFYFKYCLKSWEELLGYKVTKSEIVSKLKQLTPSDSESFIGGYSYRKQPILLGGIKLIQERLRYPKAAKENNIQGRVFVKATISKNGEVISAIIIKGIGYGCNEEAIRLVKSAKWEPGRYKGENKEAFLAIPILFRLDKE